MLGAIAGDIIGSPYEGSDCRIKSKIFPLYSIKSCFTDDTVMTCAVADGLMNAIEDGADDVKPYVIKSMQKFGREHEDAGYGSSFYAWLWKDNPQPYGSYGNGSAMRVSSVGWLYDDIDTVRKIARDTASVTHNHLEGVKGAEAVASAVYLARRGKTKEFIKHYIEEEFGYDLSRTCDEIRPEYHFVESCQETVPEAIIAFLESNDFVDAIRNAVSLGGDSDTLAAIAGGIAEPYYGIPGKTMSKTYSCLDDSLRDVIDRLEKHFQQKD